MKNLKVILGLAMSVLVALCAKGTPVSISSFNTPYNQNFDSLATSGTGNAWANDSTISGWSLFRQPAPGTAITAYNANNGGSTTGSFYSYGTGVSSERALGGLGSGGAYFGSPANGSVAGWIAAAFINDSGGTFSSFTVQWNGEQWRDGGAASPASQKMVFEYGFGSSFGTVSTWVAPAGSFDWSSPVFANTGSGAAVDGNSAGRVAGVGGSITGLTWADDQVLWLRWVERNDVGNDHGLAIDDFSFRVEGPQQSVPETLPAVFAVSALLGTLALARFVPRVARQKVRSRSGHRLS